MVRRRYTPGYEYKPQKYHGDLFNPGPIHDKAWQLGDDHLRRHYATQGKNWDLAPPAERKRAIHVLIYNSQEYWLEQAKHNLGS